MRTDTPEPVAKVDTGAASPASAASVVQTFERHASERPDAIAVVHDGTHLSYRTLNRRANRLAHALLERGVGGDCVVAVALWRTEQLPLSLLAVWKAGGVYLPLDLTAPSARLARFLTQTPAPIVITTAAGADRLPSGDSQLLCIDRDPDVRTAAPTNPVVPYAADQAAYVMYTSGSTGEPKGVVVSHAGLSMLPAEQSAHLDVRAGSRVLQFASPTFDASISEILLALTTGATLVVAADTARAGEALEEMLRRDDVTHATLTPTVLATCEPTRVHLSALLVIGEACTAALASRWAGGRLLRNAYGPTETTVCATTSEPLAGDGVPPIGQPLRGTRVYVLDPRLEPVAAGTGELYVAGMGVARGYARPAWTAERFIPDPYGPAGTRMYRTGDLVERDRNGPLVFVGRTDLQVKLRGIRVELQEIEAALRALPSVQAGVAAVRDDDGERRLVAYVVLAPGSAVEAAAIQRHLSNTLSEVMVPSAIVTLDALPKTPNGKVDRRALPAPVRHSRATRAREPRSPEERALGALFEEVLGVAHVGVDENFFGLGGHSLLAARLLQLVRERLGVSLSAEAFFEAPTVAALAEQMTHGRTAAAPPSQQGIVRVPRDGPLMLTPKQEDWWRLEHLTGNLNPNNAYFTLHLLGPLRPAALRRAVAALGRRHEAMRTAFPTATGGGAAPIISPPDAIDLCFSTIDLSRFVPSVQQRALNEILRREEARPFDLTRAPLWRLMLARLGDDDHVLTIMSHHLVCDAASNDVLMHDLAALYAAYSTGATPQFPEQRLDFVDYAQWLRAWLEGPEAAAQHTYWARQMAPPLRDLLPVSERDAAYNGPLFSIRGRVPCVIGPATIAAARRLAREAECTLFSTIAAALHLVLFAHTGERDLRVGTLLPNRDVPAFERIVGLFVNAVCLRTQIDPAATFVDLSRLVHATIGGATAHQRIPFETVSQSLGAICPPSGLLYQVLLIWLGLPPEPWILPGVRTIVGRPLDDGPSTVFVRNTLQLRIELIEGDADVRGSVTYNMGRFSQAAVEELVAAIERCILAADGTRNASIESFCNLSYRPERVAAHAGS
jgi:amino acid adenylation domain-containing protein